MPDVVALFDLYGEALTICLVGGVIGVLFGAFAQHSAFCLRSAAIEVARGRPGQGAAVWLLAFAVAVFGTQALAMAGLLDPSALRTLAEPASLSGALVGGIVFGVGMVLARGCPSRLIV
ncbi:MAG: YeeE/YedE thiosulfate transporter family protein, partial [Pseudomonadota bacterium]